MSLAWVRIKQAHLLSWGYVKKVRPAQGKVRVHSGKVSNSRTKTDKNDWSSISRLSIKLIGDQLPKWSSQLSYYSKGQ